MPLTIIKGPPNSGRTELIRERFEARLTDNPVLVVPSTDDIFGWERRLTRDRGAFVGGKVVHFKGLVEEILDKRRSEAIASPLRRRSLAAAAIRTGWPALATHLEDQPGLVDAALRSIDEFRDNLISASTFEDPELADQVGPIARVYVDYLKGLADKDLTDLPAQAESATSIPLDSWQGRPVFIAGFDDLSGRQLELIRKLSLVTDVTVAMTHERGKLAMAVTEKMLGELKDRGGIVEIETSRPATSPDHVRLLVELERAFLDRSRDGTLEPDGALTLIEASGRRGEAEAIAAEIARLVDGGVDPGEIAVAIDNPATNGGPILEVLTEYGIPATLESENRAPATATGQAVINLMAAGSPGGSSEQLFALLRGPLGLDQGVVDEVEFESRRAGESSASAVMRRFVRGRLEVPGWDQIRDGEFTEAARVVARAAVPNLVGERPDLLADSSVATESQMATAIIRAVDEIGDWEGEGLTAADLRAALTNGAVKTWAIPTAHTVQISSPYAMRAKRAGFVFVASLQERDLGAAEASPLMSSQGRSALGIPDLTDQEQQETYLFYSCLAVPTKAIWLSHRVADVHGKAEFPSAMIGEVTRLFKDGGNGLRLIRRGSSDILFAPGDAPSPHEWSLAEASMATGELPDPSLADGERLVSRARQIAESTAHFRDIDAPAAADDLASRDMFSATALEAFIECPYKWFFERAMSPVRFGPDPEALAKGNLIHKVLASLYEEHPGELPSDDDLHQWLTEMTEKVEQLAPGCDLGDDTADHRIQRRQVATELERFLRRESTRSNSPYRPVDLERKFGFEEEGSKPALQGEGWKLRGVIDRIDGAPDKSGVVIDYKSGASSYRTLAEIKREGKVQLQLYLRALEEHWGLSPAAGLYVPIFAARKNARGLVDEAHAAALKDIGLVKRDFTSALDIEIEEALERAGEAARKIMRGEIAHDPSQCLNHYPHAGVPDWNLSSGSEDGQ